MKHNVTVLSVVCECACKKIAAGGSRCCEEEGHSVLLHKEAKEKGLEVFKEIWIRGPMRPGTAICDTPYNVLPTKISLHTVETGTSPENTG